MDNSGGQRWGPESFVGGHPYLDFLNTGGGKTKARDVRGFADWAGLLDWLAAAGQLEPGERAGLQRLAAGRPARAALDRLVAHRENAYEVLAAVAHGLPPPAAGVARLENDLRAALRHATLRLSAPGPGAWRVDAAAAGLDLPRHRLALAAQTLIADGLLPRLRQCEACSWLFLDTSRGGRRRWCSMATCGNRAKARRHYRAQSPAD
ncbi:CGNR zinc finger domain-containing protein [Bordetella genomosp. 2]|uniref:CGNR zinc finger domain-containing protein n=1 Tax=Bordetella genomosp. 2 TaxID=1983456 RepID=UPI001483612F|nr:CGNR zinc finger domain-containing protein [Bordetella genomosp. 2]